MLPATCHYCTIVMGYCAVRVLCNHSLQEQYRDPLGNLVMGTVKEHKKQNSSVITQLLTTVYSSFDLSQSILLKALLKLIWGIHCLEFPLRVVLTL